MNGIRPKDTRLRLDSIAYENLRHQVLRRDGWRGQSCGAMSNLEVHHKQFRSQSGGDSEENLITLCVCCLERCTSRGGTASSRDPVPRTLFGGIRSLRARFDTLKQHLYIFSTELGNLFQ